jgi:uncharacterized Fe-S cluster protein YjdI
MLFFRTTLLLGMGVLVLPTDEASQARVYQGARTAVTWTTTFCDRNAETCVKGGEYWAVFKKKAEFGAKMAYDLVSERNAQSANAAPALAATPSPAAPGGKFGAHPQHPVLPTRSTLKPSDLEPAWRGTSKVARAG